MVRFGRSEYRRDWRMDPPPFVIARFRDDDGPRGWFKHFDGLEMQWEGQRLYGGEVLWCHLVPCPVPDPEPCRGGARLGRRECGFLRRAYGAGQGGRGEPGRARQQRPGDRRDRDALAAKAAGARHHRRSTSPTWRRRSGPLKSHQASFETPVPLVTTSPQRSSGHHLELPLNSTPMESASDANCCGAFMTVNPIAQDF